MFGFGKSKKDYKKICKSPEDVYHLLYSDRRKTSEILGNDEFISAWLDGDKQREISMIIRKEAIAGDIPSLKQMVWLLGIMHQEVSGARMAKEQKLTAVAGILEERIKFCNSLIDQGLVQQHYYAMISCHNLYRALYDQNESGTIQKTRDVLNEMVEHAQAIIRMGKDHPAIDGDEGIIEDAKNILLEGSDLRKLLNAMGDSVSKLDGSR